MFEPRAIRILIADDHALIRDALPLAIQGKIPAAVFTGVATASAVVAAAERERWDLIVMDLGLPGAGEMETLRRVRVLQPATPILVLSMFPEEKMGGAAIAAGANGYLCKTADRAAIAHAAAETLAGRGHISEKLRTLLEQPAARSREVNDLSQREFEVLVALGHGFSNKEIAGQLGISVTSVGTYRARVLDKLAFRTNADLVRYVVANQLVRAG